MTKDVSLRELKGQLKAIKTLNKYEMDLRTWEILVLIGLEEGAGTLTLSKKYGIPKSAFSRHVLFLCGRRSHKGNRKEDVAQNVSPFATKLVEKRDDPMDLRTHALYLTPMGKKLIAEVSEAIAA